MARTRAQCKAEANGGTGSAAHRVTDNDSAVVAQQPAKKSDNRAARQVANTYELVEQILIHLCELEPIEIIKAEAVSKTFQHVLRRSKNVQLTVPIPDAVEPGKAISRDTITNYYWGLPPIFEDFEITRDRRPIGNRPEILLRVRVDHAQLGWETWRTGGVWRSWLALRRSFNPGGVTYGDYCVALKYTTDTAITLGKLVDIAYELADLSESDTYVEFEFAIDEEGVAMPWLKRCSGWSAAGEQDRFPEYHRAMEVARTMKQLWKDSGVE